MHKGHRVEYSYHVFHGRFNDPAVRDYHERLQFFLLMFIDRSSFIDAEDLVWEVLVTFEKAYNRGTQEVCLRADFSICNNSSLIYVLKRNVIHFLILCITHLFYGM